MRGNALDQALSEILRQGLGLTGHGEDVLWAEFRGRAKGEAKAWSFFLATMIRNGMRLWPAIVRSSWAGSPAHVRR